MLWYYALKQSNVDILARQLSVPRFGIEMKTLRILLFLLILQMLSLQSSTVRADDIVEFPDPNLRAAIGRAIGKLGGNIYKDDLLKLTILDVDSLHIKNLSGLEYCTNLEVIDLTTNQISDIAPLSELTKLKRLFLGHNLIENVSPLSGLHNLTNLDLGGNRITVLTALSNLASLDWLDLASNRIGDVSPLSDLTSLTVLNLEANVIGNITALSGLTSLQEINLSGNKVADITPLLNLADPRFLDLADNNISDISPLIEIARLDQGDTVDLTDNPLSAASIEVHIPALVEKDVNVISNAIPTPTVEPGTESKLNPGVIFGPIIAAVVIILVTFRLLYRFITR